MERAATTLLQVTPRDFVALSLRGRARGSLGKHAEAVKDLERGARALALERRRGGTGRYREGSVAARRE